MFIPNINAMHFKKSPVRTIHGKESFLVGKQIRCAIVHLSDNVVVSSVRADSSASRGSAEDLVAQAKLLVPINVIVTNGDVIELHGFRIEVTGKQPRIDTSGRLDHYEVMGKIKAEE